VLTTLLILLQAALLVLQALLLLVLLFRFTPLTAAVSSTTAQHNTTTTTTTAPALHRKVASASANGDALMSTQVFAAAEANTRYRYVYKHTYCSIRAVSTCMLQADATCCFKHVVAAIANEYHSIRTSCPAKGYITVDEQGSLMFQSMSTSHTTMILIACELSVKEWLLQHTLAQQQDKPSGLMYVLSALSLLQ
jgi:hypothetical protein